MTLHGKMAFPRLQPGEWVLETVPRCQLASMGSTGWLCLDF